MASRPHKKRSRRVSTGTTKNAGRSAPGRGVQKDIARDGFATNDELLRHRIIRAAADAYREQGYRRTTMTEIAKRLNLTAPALYWYFPSKEQILFAFLDSTLKNLLEFVNALALSPDPARRLWEFVHAHVLWQMNQKDLSAPYERIWATLRETLSEEQRVYIEALERKMYDNCKSLIIACVGERLAPKEVSATVFAIFGMIEHMVRWFQPNKGLSVPDIARFYADSALAMVNVYKERKRG